MAGAFIAVHLSLRKASFKVMQIDIAKNRIVRTPKKQHWNVGECANPLSDAIELSGAGVVTLEWNVGYELSNSGTSGRLAIRGQVRVGIGLTQAWVGPAGNTAEAGCRADEQGGESGIEIQERT
jgi:hypothetical protein